MAMLTNEALERSAQAAGIEVTWTDAFGKPNRLSEKTIRRLLDLFDRSSKDEAPSSLLTAAAGSRVRLPESWKGSRRLALRSDTGAEETLIADEQGSFDAPMTPGYYAISHPVRKLCIAVAPPTCFSPADCYGTQRSRGWGLAAQVYSLRRHRDGGLGDSRAVEELATQIGERGGDAIALSPIHAVSATAPHYSPYTPSHRAFLDWVYADPSQLFGKAELERAVESAELTERWHNASSKVLVDWPDVRDMRSKVFRALHRQFLQAHSSLHNDLKVFAANGGEHLRDYARFTVRENMARAHQRPLHGRHAVSDTFPDEEAFEIFAQWVARRCWEKTQKSAKEAGQRIGLIWDQAVGCDPNGSEAWSYRDALLQDVQLGAPPDAFNRDGQQWGITTYSPWGLLQSGFQPYIDLLRANMSRGGGIRVDHIIGLQRMWVVPDGCTACEGGYLRYPLTDMLRLLALESWRQRCIVIGEDLGTVPDGIRRELAAHGVLGIDVLMFMRDETGAFIAPEAWRESAVATTTTHDLPTLVGWRKALDLKFLAASQSWSSELCAERLEERSQTVRLLDQSVETVLVDPNPSAASSNWNYFAHVAKSPAPLLLIPAEDAIGKSEQPNLPGTIDSYPNWRHRLPADSQLRLVATLEWLQRCTTRDDASWQV